MKIQFRHVPWLAAFVVTTLAFQNCSPYHVSSGAVGVTDASSVSNGPTGVMVSAIMATGHMGRSLMSCDGGRTWIHDRSDDDSARCWVDGDPNEVECDHNVHAGHLVDYANGYFYADYGWGFNGSLRRSADGVHWDTLRTDGWGPGAITVGNDMLLTWGNWQMSEDGGSTWTSVTTNYGLGHDYVPHHFGNKIVTMSGDGTIGVSDDVGRTWPSISHVDPSLTNVIAAGNGVIVVGGSTTADSNGNNNLITAVSTDNGQTWSQPQSLSPGYFTSWQGMIFNGTKFVGWGANKMWTSTDGMNWTSTPIVSGFMSGQVIYHPATSTYVVVSSVWGNYYGSQKAYYSTDGINWVTLDSAHFKGGHPINSIVIGNVDSSACVGP